MDLPFYDDHFGKFPILKSRGVIGQSLVNISAVGALIDWANVFISEHKLDITSSSNSDAWAGTGTMKIVIYGLDKDYLPLVEEVTVTGQAKTSTVNSFRRVFAAYSTVNGIGNKNAGDIYIIKTGTSTWTAGVPDTLTSGCIKMLANNNLGYSGVFTAPRGCIYKVLSYVPAANRAASIQILQGFPAANSSRGPYAIFKVDIGVGVGSASIDTGIMLTEKTDIYTQGEALAAATNVTSIMRLQKV